MMAIGDILAARADNARARGTVEAGTLGTVTVEALPVRELERLMRGADGDRAVFYAACRELQGAGAALLRAGKVYRPDQVMALVSDAEAAKAAEAVRALSGWTETETNGKVAEVLPAENTDGDSAGAGEAADTGASSEASDGTAGEAAAHGTDTDKKAAFPAVTSDRRAPDNGRSRGQRFDCTADGTDEGAGGQDSHETDKKAEIRPDVVQVNAEVRREAVQKKTADAAFRPDTVREKAGKKAEIRHMLVTSRPSHTFDFRKSRLRTITAAVNTATSQHVMTIADAATGNSPASSSRPNAKLFPPIVGSTISA